MQILYRINVVGLFLLLFLIRSHAAEIYIGTASVDITPQGAVALDGQMTLRVANKVDNSITANVIVINGGDINDGKNASVLVSCDLVAIPSELLTAIKQDVAKRLKVLDTEKIIINATHTHTGPVVRQEIYLIPKDIIQPKDYYVFLIGKISDAIVQAFNNQQKASVSWGLDYAKVAFNRRASYDDGHALMYGSTKDPSFRKIEGYEDDSVNSMFFWNEKGDLLATCINVSSPAQIVESRSTVNADYWHFVRKELKNYFGQNLCVVGMIGAAGDQAPRPMYNQKADHRMAQLKQVANFDVSDQKSVDFQTEYYLQEVASRIVQAVLRSHEAVKKDKHAEVVVQHVVDKLELPMRLVTKEEYDGIKKEIETDMVDEKTAVHLHRKIVWNKEALSRYEDQEQNSKPTFSTEIHALRIGDIVICTNPFELFTDYGIQIKSRSKALQTFVVQLVGEGSYLPTQLAVEGGHYSAIVQSSLVGPEGGQLLVEKTLELLNEVW